MLGSVQDSLVARRDAGVFLRGDVFFISELRHHMAKDIAYVLVESRGRLDVGVGRNSAGEPEGCVTLPPLRKREEKTGDPTDGSCPVVNISAILEAVDWHLQHIDGIESSRDLLREEGQPRDMWVVAVHDWRHFDRAVSALTEVLRRYDIDTSIAVAIEPPRCVRKLGT